MAELTGRRAANHAATHRAILTAANRLFAEQGFGATSIREIAQVAGIGERTFYRYFETKEALLADEVDSWLVDLAEAIDAQPRSTPPLTAARNAIGELLEGDEGDGPVSGWLLHSAPRPLELLRRAVAPRPLRRFEETIADALTARGAPASDSDLVARVTVAIVRSAVVSARNNEDGPTSIAGLVDDGFDALERLVTAGGEAQESPRRRARRSKTANAISVAAERMRSSG